jgi:hypothetical protein
MTTVQPTPLSRTQAFHNGRVLTTLVVDLLEIDTPTDLQGAESSKATTNGSKKPVIIDDDEEEEEEEADGDEETFAVEKILNHRIRPKGVVPSSDPEIHLISPFFVFPL